MDAPAPLRSVLLRHDLPDGSWHFDWMIERPPAPPAHQPALITFRIRHRLDLEPPPEFEALRLADHRPAYLEYEGDLSDNRGRVARLARARVLALTLADDAIDLTLDWAAGPQRWLGRHPSHSRDPDPVAGHRWFFRLQT